MEMPDVIYAKKKNGCDGEFYRATSNKYDGLRKMFEYNDKYHHDRILKAKDAEIESLHLEIDECHKALKRWAYSHDELRLEVELRKEIDELKDKLYKAMQGTQGAKK